MAIFDNSPRNGALGFLDWLNEQDKTDPDRWIHAVARVKKLETRDPRLGNREYMLDAASELYIKTLQSRLLKLRTPKYYRSRVERLFTHFPHPFAMEALQGMLDAFDDPTDTLDGVADLIASISTVNEVSSEADALDPAHVTVPLREVLMRYTTDLAEVQDDLKAFCWISTTDVNALNDAIDALERKHPRLSDRRYVSTYAAAFYIATLIEQDRPFNFSTDYVSIVEQLSLWFKRPLLLFRFVVFILRSDEPDKMLERGAALATEVFGEL